MGRPISSLSKAITREEAMMMMMGALCGNVCVVYNNFHPP